jgi:hypothetical protein
MPRETPQEKKARSLAHDRRNTYGENNKSSRTAIRQRKQWSRRMRRQALRRALDRAVASDPETLLDTSPRSWWRKCPDTSLRHVLLARRVTRLERDLRARLAADANYLERLEQAAIREGLDERFVRPIFRQLRTDLTQYRSDLPTIPDDTLALLQRLVRRLT